MGEAARRRSSDKFFGKIPKQGLGLVISNPMMIDGPSISFSGQLDPQELRYSMLFWDRLVWPDNNIIHVDGGAEAQFLENAGLLTRPRYVFTGSGNGGEIISQIHLNAFLELCRSEPGLWTMARGERSFLVKDNAFRQEGGLLFELVGAIPVPDKDVPLEDVLNFKHKRRDELLSLRIVIDDFIQNISAAGDSETAIRKAISEIELNCIDVMKVSKEQNKRFRLVNTKLSYNIDLAKIVGAGFASFLTSELFSLTALSGVLVALGSSALTGASVKFGGDISLQTAPRQAHPFRYVSSFHDELFS